MSTINNEKEQSETTIMCKKIMNFSQIDGEGMNIQIEGFLESLKKFKKFGFFTIRSGLDKIQCVFNLNEFGEQKFTELASTPLESFVSVYGIIQKANSPIKSCTVKNFELEVKKFLILSRSKALPFDIKDINVVDEGVPTVSFNKRLDNRIIDLRGTMSQSIFRIIDDVMHSFRTFLRAHDFVEIKTSKLLGSGTEGGANLFQVDFFNKKAYLAQSPQLYKQMAVIGGFKRVYEIGHVYRAEESNINRYLSEFIGLDIEMETNNYEDTLHFIYKMFISIFDSLKKNKFMEMENLKAYFKCEDLRYPEEPLIFTHKECVDILRNNQVEIDYLDDFSRANEKKLGDIISETREIDFFLIKDYPKKCRPFYTAELEDSIYSQSYDGILRGEEIFSGARRITDYDTLVQSAKDNGINPTNIESYLNTFQFGAPSHAGCGIGLERFVKAFFGSKDIRFFNLFPRDPGRLNP